MTTIGRTLVRCLLTLTLLATVLIASTAVSRAQPCDGAYTIGVGGMGDSLSLTFEVFANVDQAIVYASVSFPHTGVDAFDHAVRAHRVRCPGDHITAIGHSGGALALHRWASYTQFFDRLNLILLADPAQYPGGMLGQAPLDQLPWPRGGGVDANFGGIPTLSVCFRADPACNWTPLSWAAFLIGSHIWPYNYHPEAYPQNAKGMSWL